MVAILILAAGQSYRMRGTDKLSELIDGIPLLRLQVQRARDTGHPVYVAIPALNHPRADQLSGLGARLIPVPDAAQGMAQSLRTGLAMIPDEDAVLISLADLVEIDVPDLQAVVSAMDAAPAASIWRGATADGRPGHPVLISPDIRHAFAELTGDTGGADVLRRYRDKTHLVPLPGNRARLDLDTPEDWAAWRAKRQT